MCLAGSALYSVGGFATRPRPRRPAAHGGATSSSEETGRNPVYSASLFHRVYIAGVYAVCRVFQEVISEDLRATLNAFLYRTGEQSTK